MNQRYGSAVLASLQLIDLNWKKCISIAKQMANAYQWGKGCFHANGFAPCVVFKASSTHKKAHCRVIWASVKDPLGGGGAATVVLNAKQEEGQIHIPVCPNLEAGQRLLGPR